MDLANLELGKLRLGSSFFGGFWGKHAFLGRGKPKGRAVAFSFFAFLGLFEKRHAREGVRGGCLTYGHKVWAPKPKGSRGSHNHLAARTPNTSRLSCAHHLHVQFLQSRANMVAHSFGEAWVRRGPLVCHAGPPSRQVSASFDRTWDATLGAASF